MSDTSVAVPSDHTNQIDRDDPGGRAWVPVFTWAVLALMLGAMAAAMFASHRDGHWWGDDWALYIRQAQGLLDGNPGQVIDENEFTVEASRGAAFSPPLYPWGFPVILAPFVAFVGADVDRLAVVPVLCAMVFAASWFMLARRRLGPLPALVFVVAVTLTPLLMGWTELIQSEWPFLAVTAVVLVGIDRLADRGAFVDLGASWWPVAAVGLGAAAAFSVRREGLAMVGAIAAAQLAALIAADREWWGDRERRSLMAIRLLIPHVAALAAVGLTQVVLPSTLVPRYSGTSVRNVWKFRRDHLDHLAEVTGLKRTWQDSPEVLGSTTLGWIAVIAFVVAALVGAVLAIVMYRRRDLHLVVYAIGALLIGGSFRAPINRYVCSIAPVMLLLGAAAIATVAKLVPWRHTATIVVAVILGALAVGNVIQAATRINNAQRAADAGSIEWGPTHPLSIEMFDAVNEITEPGDIVAGPKARALTLETGLLAVQVDEYRPIPPDVPIALLVVDRSTDFGREMALDSGPFHQVWDNGRFVLYAPTVSS